MNLFRSYQGPEPLRWPRFDDFVAYDSEELNSTARFVASLRDALPLLEDAMGGSALGSRIHTLKMGQFLIADLVLGAPEFTHCLRFFPVKGTQQTHTTDRSLACLGFLVANPYN